MRTEELIEQLAGDPAARLSRTPRLRFALSILLAALLALVILAASLGAPLAALSITGVAPFALKLGFSLSLMLASAAALFASGRPGSSLRGLFCLVALPFAVVIALAVSELAAADPAWPGATWKTCLASIGLLTPLAFVGSILALRRLAPVNLRISGALAGIASAATAATAYALWCPETEAVFLLNWYAAPIALAGIIGALLGPRLLRW